MSVAATTDDLMRAAQPVNLDERMSGPDGRAFRWSPGLTGAGNHQNELVLAH